MMTLDDTTTTATRHRIRLIGALVGAATTTITRRGGTP
jgi:hypothetical protein